MSVYRYFVSWRLISSVVALVVVSLISATDCRSISRADEPAKYVFAVPPLEIYNRLKDLKLGDHAPISQPERELLEKRWRDFSTEKPTNITQEELRDLLIYASGVDKPDEVEKLRGAYAKLLAESKEALKDCKTAPERAEKLLTFLHASAMNQGYDLKKLTLAEIFEEHKYNCVSSTALYCLLGQDNGLKLQPISVPGSDFQAGHATVDLIENGQRIQIEPTNKDGFDWDTKLKQPGVISFNFGPKRETGHDVDLWAVPAMMYYNRGNRFKQANCSEQLAMIRCYVSAVALAPTDPSATKNMISALTNWGPGLVEAGRFAEATRAMDFAYQITPHDSGIAGNRRNVWQKHILHLLHNKQDAEAMQIAQLAITEFPNDSDFKSRVHWFEWLGSEIRKKEGHEAALAIVERGEKVLNAEELKALLDWRTSITRLQSQHLLEQENYTDSFSVLKRFYDPKSPDRELTGGIIYHTQEALSLAFNKGGASEALSHYRDLRAAFASIDGLPEVALGFTHRSVSALLQEKQYEKARERVNELMPLLETEEAKAEVREQLCNVWISDLLKANAYEKAVAQAAALADFLESDQAKLELQERIYQTWISDLIKAKNWESALAKAQDAMKALPQSSDLKSRGADVIIIWSKASMDAKNWDEAIKIYEIGLQHFPGDSRLTNNLEYCKEHRAK